MNAIDHTREGEEMTKQPSIEHLIGRHVTYRRDCEDLAKYINDLSEVVSDLVDYSKSEHKALRATMDALEDANRHIAVLEAKHETPVEKYVREQSDGK